jgi:transposase
MKGWQMYSKIQAMKERGFSIRQVSRMIRVSRNTIKKYWEMKPDEYAAAFTAMNRMTALMAYEPVVLNWLETFPDMTAGQVRDWLLERHKLDAAERTVRRFVLKLREKHGITKASEPRRQYEAVEEMPKGYQLQLDFGEKKVRDAYQLRYIKLYFAVFMLTYSRYKWGIFQEKPFTSADLVRALYGCFDYYGGMPRELVYDQDSILVVSENNGDIIHTQAFTAFLSETRIGTRVCRKSDPETKGKIEATVKFVKGNFMENRYYMGCDIWNQSFEEWLERTGNGRVHGTTKRKSSEMFLEEREHLLPLYGHAPVDAVEYMERNVRLDNTVMYLSNRYSVPLGTYGREKTVLLSVQDDKLHIMDRIAEPITTHEISRGRGRLVTLESHRRNKRGHIDELLNQTVALLGEEFREYLTVLCQKRPRYVKEQLGVVINACKAYGRERVVTAMKYCQELELYSAGDLNEAAVVMSEQAPLPLPRLPVEDERYHVNVQKRALSAYAEVACTDTLRESVREGGAA